MEGCKKYYAIDIIVDGNVIRKGKYTKVFTPVSYSWLDYNDIEIVDQNEIRRLDAAATEDNEVSEIYDNYHNFMSSSNTIDTVSAIPMDKHIVLVNWTPGGDHEAISMKYNVGIEGDNYLIYVSNVGENSSTIYLPQVEEGDTSVVNHIVPGNISSNYTMVNLGFDGSNQFAESATKLAGIYSSALSKDDCIKAYNYLQTLKSK